METVMRKLAASIGTSAINREVLIGQKVTPAFCRDKPILGPNDPDEGIAQAQGNRDKLDGFKPSSSDGVIEVKNLAS